jgi:hypothetical protein
MVNNGDVIYCAKGQEGLSFDPSSNPIKRFSSPTPKPTKPIVVKPNPINGLSSKWAWPNPTWLSCLFSTG